MEEDGFTLVKNHGKRKQQFAYPKLSMKATKFSHDSEPTTSLTSKEEVDKVMKWALKTVNGSNLPPWLTSRLREILKRRQISTIRAIGVGSFHSMSNFGATQLAVLLHLQQEFPQTTVVFQDPILCQAETEWLEDHQILILPTDDLLRVPDLMPSSEEPQVTLCFMPHCEHFMYNNLLLSYWNLASLRNTIILGNNLRSLVESCPEKHLHEISVIKNYAKLAMIEPLPSCDDYPYAFSDTCLMWLDENTKQLSVDFTDFVPKYEYFRPVM